jgi:NAD-dependent deacetylase
VTPEGLAAAARALRGASSVVITTGAGMSRESGIPTFREAQDGLWARFDPAELATEEAFRRDPGRVWSWYAHRLQAITACAPHAGHLAVARLQELLREVTLVTQNIDGLHQLAGSRGVIELHGSIRRYSCLDRRHPAALRDDPAAEAPPPCDRCGSPLRPDVVWFGEILPEEAVSRAWEAAARCGVMLVVGTSGIVYPAAALPQVAREAGATVIEVNAAASGITPLADIFLQGPAGRLLPQLVRAVETARSGAGRAVDADGPNPTP